MKLSLTTPATRRAGQAAVLGLASAAACVGLFAAPALAATTAATPATVTATQHSDIRHGNTRTPDARKGYTRKGNTRTADARKGGLPASSTCDTCRPHGL